MSMIWEERILNYCDRSEFQPALKLTQLRLIKNPDDGRMWELQGLVYFGMDDFRNAVRALERATLLKPLANAARICLAQSYGRIGRVALSLDLLRGLITYESLTVANLLQLAASLDDLNQPQLALQACRRAMQEDSMNAQACYDMGYYSARCGCPPHVTEALARKAISLNPEEVHYQVGLAALLLRLDRPDDAFKIVARFEMNEISQICCRCCLQRILALYERQQDDYRISLCHRQLLTLKQQKPASGCND